MAMLWAWRYEQLTNCSNSWTRSSFDLPADLIQVAINFVIL